MRVLVCERDLATVTLVRRFLEGRGHEVAVAHDDPEAHRQLVARWPDLVVLDAATIGLRLLETLREKPWFEEVFCIVLTPCPDRAAIAHAYGIGADMVLIKPFHPLELLPLLPRD